MIALGIILAVLALILLPLLFNPLQFRIDTVAQTFFLRWQGLGSARLVGGAEDPAIRIWVLGWRKQYHLLDLAASRPAKAEEPTEGKPSNSGKKAWKRPRWLTWRFGLRMLRTFRVRELRLVLDTGDFVHNAYLYPLFQRLSGGRRQLAINFQGRNELVLDMSNRVSRMVWTFLTNFITTKYHRI